MAKRNAADMTDHFEGNHGQLLEAIRGPQDAETAVGEDQDQTRAAHELTPCLEMCRSRGIL
jgi:hypothetical protein